MHTHTHAPHHQQPVVVLFLAVFVVVVVVVAVAVVFVVSDSCIISCQQEPAHGQKQTRHHTQNFMLGGNNKQAYSTQQYDIVATKGGS